MLNKIVRCLLIPIGGGQLLLPNAVVAEVCSCGEPEQVADNQPNWLLGIINWRDQNIPLLSIEEALSLPQIATPVKKYRTVVLYGLETTQSMPFYAFRTVEVPRAFTVKEADLTNSNAEERMGLVSSVMYNEDTVWLPDLTYLENLLRKFPLLLRPT
ncbi:MAG: hypothetical protein DRR19_04455 [Candidatus Parabeggiatoa sp. nov. 1]|nr:MAG: hypothetical protein DRR19_04455 [Gammaproteobacteria bacterium]